MSRLSTTTWDVVEHLKTEEDMALYLEAAIEDGDPDLITAAVGDIARARGQSELVPGAGQEGNGNPELGVAAGSDLAAMLGVIKSLGLRLRVVSR
jgi:probable addiction module antidote protein